VLQEGDLAGVGLRESYLLQWVVPLLECLEEGRPGEERFSGDRPGRPGAEGHVPVRTRLQQVWRQAARGAGVLGVADHVGADYS